MNKMKNKTQKCKGCKKEISIEKESGFCNSCYAKDYRKRNKDKIRVVSQKYRMNNLEKRQERERQYHDKYMFSGNAQAALERDNFQCQECGITQEQHIIIFGFRLTVHHIDGAGKNTTKEDKNNDMGNLITLCVRCHISKHNILGMKERWGELIEQDDSEWKYPKIRYLVETEIKKGIGVQEAKRKVSEDTGMSFTLIDHRYYDKKHDTKRNKPAVEDGE